MTTRPLEIGAAIGFLALAAAGWLASADLPAAPRLFPRLILGLLALSAVFWLAGLLRPADVAPGDAPALAPPRRAWVMPAIFAVTGVYAVVVVTVGFFLPTLVYIPVTAWLLGERRWQLSLMAAVAFVVVAYLLFVVLFERPVPL